MCIFEVVKVSLEIHYFKRSRCVFTIETMNNIPKLICNGEARGGSGFLKLLFRANLRESFISRLLLLLNWLITIRKGKKKCNKKFT